MAACWPEAELHTLLYDAEGTGHRFSARTVSTSYLQRLGFRQGGFRCVLPLFLPPSSCRYAARVSKRVRRSVARTLPTALLLSALAASLLSASSWVAAERL